MANTARLVIDPVSRKISTKYEKIRLVQHDNNSTRVTFEMPRYVRGHDMSNCSTVEVHYDNVSVDRKQKNSDVYVVKDIVVAPEDDTCINFSWLVSRAATQLVGSIEFSLHFGRTEDPSLDYAWHTTTYSGINVLAGKHNTQSVVERHPDLVAAILEKVEEMLNEYDDALGGKVSSSPTTRGVEVYAREQGEDKTFGLTMNGTKWNVAWYAPPDQHGTTEPNGTLSGAMPENPYNFAPRKYVDDGLLKKLDALTNGDNNTTWLYGNDYTGKYGIFKASPHGKSGHIVMYGAPDRTAGSEPDGTIGVHMPEKPYQAVPREYVDTNTPAQIAVSMNTTEGEGEEQKEYVLRLSLVNRKGDVIPDSETSIDLPLEMAFVGAEAVEDEDGNEFVEFTLQNGEKLRVGLSEIFNGKVDKITDKTGMWVYTQENGKQNKRRLATSPSSYSIPLYNTNHNLATRTPVDDLDAANKQYVDDGLAGKFSLPTTLKPWSILGIGDYNAETGEYKPNLYTRDPVGCGNAFIATFALATNATIWDKEYGNLKYTLGVPDPIKPIQVANKRYVDGKVEPIVSDVAILFDALGGAIEYASVDSKDNPVTVPSNVFPAATIDKIGTGIKTDVDSIVSSVIHDFSPTGVTVSYNDGLYTINSTEYINETVGFSAELSKPLSEGDTYYFLAEVVSGSYDISGEGDLFVADGVNVIKVGELFHGTADHDGAVMSTPINIRGASVKYNNLVLRISIGEAVSVYGVPVASVKKGDETIYTVPEAIRALTYDDNTNLGAMPVYGLAMSDTVYNYLDLEKKQYVIKCAQNIYGEIWETSATIDVSEHLTDEDGEITVAADDEILFVDADGNSVGSTVPSTITYIVKKGASE